MKNSKWNSGKAEKLKSGIAGFYSPVTRYWLLVTGYWLLVTTATALTGDPSPSFIFSGKQ